MKKLALFVSAFVFAALSTHAAVEKYKIDPAHSSVGFKIRHFFTPVPGTFTVTDGTITVDRDDLAKSSVSVTIGAATVSTDNAKRDGELKAAGFFDTDKFPTIIFTSKSWKKTGADTFDVTGDLTIKDKTKEVILQVTSLGFGPGMRGTTVSGWEATTKLNRRDFGVNGPSMLDKVISDDVTVSISVEAGLQK